MFRLILTLSTSILIGTSPASATHSYEEQAAAAELAKPMSRSAVYNLYSNKTWQWEHGSAYFGLGRLFTAFSNKNGKPSYAIGFWKLGLAGEMCFNATWAGKGYRVPKKTCFKHREADGVIYQQTPEGVWYAFKHSPALDSDEFQNLKAGNPASRDFHATRAKVLSRQ